MEDEGQAEEVLVFRRSINRTGEAKFQAEALPSRMTLIII